MAQPNRWYVYVVRCNDGTYYTGVSTDLRRRINEHNGGKSGAKYTKVRRPVQLVYFEETSSRSEATKREWRIKKMTRVAKKELVAGGI